jgi:hypothetical protein
MRRNLVDCCGQQNQRNSLSLSLSFSLSLSYFLIPGIPGTCGCVIMYVTKLSILIGILILDYLSGPNIITGVFIEETE